MALGIIRRITVAALVLAVLLGLAAIGGKYAIEAKARQVSRSFVDDVRESDMGPDDLLVALTREVHETFQGGTEYETRPLLYALRPYLTHNLLPSLLRVEAGAIDALYVKGFCDSAARTLAFILNSIDVPAWQFNIVTYRGSGHVVTLARPTKDRKVMLDPLLGIVPQRNGRLLGPEEARTLAQDGVPMSELWKPLASTSNDEFYNRFGDVVFARQGQPLQLEVSIDLGAADAVTLGTPNGQYGDVGEDGIKHGWTAYLHYLGHRYDRGWTRTLHFPQATRVTFGLMEPARENVITSDRSPVLRGTAVIYEMPGGSTLRLHDGRAQRDWLRFRSYQNVDYVRFERLTGQDR